MTETSPRLGMPYIQPSQAQKHVVHNEALQQLDTLVQMVVQATDATTVPGTPEPGEVHALGTGATGAWAGQDNTLAMWAGEAWVFVPLQIGWRAWDMATGRLLVWTGSSWDPAQMLDNLDHLGVNTSADTTNRLAVASDAALFTHDGAGHQLKVNKATAGDTAALLFQTNWTGHAEVGLAGNNDFHIKQSDDGTAFTTTLSALSANGFVGVGTQTPSKALHIQRDDGSAAVLVEETSAIAAPRKLLELANNGVAVFGMVSTEGGTPFQWSLQNRGAAANNEFRITNSTGAGEEFVLSQDGDLTVTGQVTAGGPMQAKSCTVASAPSASTAGAGAMVFVSDEAGGATMAFSDGTDWRRMTDRAVIS